MKVLFVLAGALLHLVHSHPRDDTPNYLRADEAEIRVYEEKENFRLNDDTWPHLYKVRINAFNHPEQTYTGEVEIEFTAQNSVSEIVLNQQGITLQDWALFEVEEGERNVEIELSSCALDNDYEKIICALSEGQLDTLKAYVLDFKYTGAVHNDMRGFYESYYKDGNGEKKTLGTTHFGQQGRRLLPVGMNRVLRHNLN